MSKGKSVSLQFLRKIGLLHESQRALCRTSKERKYLPCALNTLHTCLRDAHQQEIYVNRREVVKKADQVKSPVGITSSSSSGPVLITDCSFCTGIHFLASSTAFSAS